MDGGSRSLEYIKLVALPTLAAWVLLALADRIASFIPWSNVDVPSLPRVSTPNGMGGDVRSTIPALFISLFVGVACAIVAEAGKYGAAKLRAHRLFWLIGLYQCVLVIEALRVGAEDWLLWLLSWLGIVDLHVTHERSWDLPLPVPWIALGCALLVCCITYVESRRPTLSLEA